MEELLPDLYKVEVPLPGNPLKSINSYFIRGAKRNLIIDTGMNRPECRQVMEEAIRTLRFVPQETDFFITHLHADHSGLVAHLATPDSKVYCSGPDIEVIRRISTAVTGEAHVMKYAARSGFSEAEANEIAVRHPGFRYSAQGEMHFETVQDGDVVEAGPYSFTCVATPGHTMGHMCLFEKERRIFLSGDHILGDITPNISHWTDEGDSLGQYLASLDAVEKLDIGQVFPGHRRLIPDWRARVAELRRHHEVRAAEALAILNSGPQNAYHVAGGMTWDMTCSWAEFPAVQKWFAVGEAMAHLRWLVCRGQAKTREQDGMLLFSPG